MFLTNRRISSFSKPESLLNNEEIDNFNFSLASPEVIASWSHGALTNSNVIEPETAKPIVGGLFCPKVFGVAEDGKCLCGKLFDGETAHCAECLVDWLPKEVAKFRFGHIDLAAPVVHTWFCKSAISVLALLTGLSAEDILKVMNFTAHVVVSPIKDVTNADRDNELNVGKLINDVIHARLWEQKHHWSLASGGAAILFLLEHAKLHQIKTKLTAEIDLASSISQLKALKSDYDMIENMIVNNINPQWIVLKLLPVMPAILRPILPLEGDDNFSNSDLNVLYGRVINANNAVLDSENSFTASKAPNRTVYLKLLNELQHAIDELIDTSVTTESVRYSSTPMKSLTSILKGKEGRFRQSLLGRRVDYSARSVIAPGPHLRLWECGLPKEIALELFKPFIYAKILTLMNTNDITIAQQTWIDDPKLIDSILETLVRDRPVVLNRAPTLHKLSMLAFKCVIINEKVIRLHPLVCSGFNADFDGDQMAVHIPLSEEARLEACDLLLATRNVLHPADGAPAILPNQDMVLGLYYASLVSDGEIDIFFGTHPDVQESLARGEVKLHTKVMFLHKVNGKVKATPTTPGRLLISRLIPKQLNILYTADMPELTKENLYELVEFVADKCGLKQMATFCEKLMFWGFRFVTKSGISLCPNDFKITDYKNFLIKRQRRKLSQTLHLESQPNQFKTIAGLRKPWIEIIKQIEINSEVSFNSEIETKTAAQIIVNSGARGTISQVKQIMGARGQVSSFSGEVCKMPILTSYIEGLTPIQFFHATCSARRGLIDSTLKTATSGYFTRKLVEACREYMITEWDCETTEGLNVDLLDDKQFICNSIVGRVLLNPIIKDNKTIINKNELLTRPNVDKLLDNCSSVLIRSPLTCCAPDGLCSLCYGLNLSTGFTARIGDSVGVIAAQAISEPGTQMTLRTFHGLTESSNTSEASYESQRLICAPYSGTISYESLACVRSPNGNTSVANDDAVCMIMDAEKILWKCDLRCGDFLLAYNGERIRRGKLIGLRRSTECFDLALMDGRVRVYSESETNAVPNLTLVRGEPPIYVELNNDGDKFLAETDPEAQLLVSTGSQVNVFDQITSLKSGYAEGEVPNLEQGLAKLSKLFDGQPNEIVFNMVPTDEEYYELFFHEVDGSSCVGVKIEEDPADGSKGEEHTDLFSEFDSIDFNKFASAFISQVQAVYSSYGISLNNKHIEILLNQMINEVVIVTGGQSGYETGDKVSWQTFAKQNEMLKRENLTLATGIRVLRGVSDINVHQASPLSDISFEGPVKSLAISAVEGKDHSLSAVKDHIMTGKLPLVGTGTIPNKSHDLSFGN
ncbi:MAG: hypothetical protein ACTS6G_02475 [Candidatus Hodgkinia cicadicola]